MTPTLIDVAVPGFCEGIQYFGRPWPGFETHAQKAAIPEGHSRIKGPTDPDAVYQTLLAADALRYLTLQVTGTKASGHPGGFASSAEYYAALVMLGHTNIITEAGHHAPGFYSALFLDTSLQQMGIRTVRELCQRFREHGGLLGHVSGAVPGILAPAGPLGQGQHFAMAGALLHPGILFPFTVGDGGLGEPYVLSSMMHFHTTYPEVTNFMPVLIWNGYSQEHHAMVSRLSDQQMIDYWKGHGFEEVVLVDAKCFDDQDQPGPYVDSTVFSLQNRLAFAAAVLESADRAARWALDGKLTVAIIKQLKGAGVHAVGSRSHNLVAGDTLDKPQIIQALKRRALNPGAWQIVRDDFSRAGGGPVARTAVSFSPPPLPPLPKEEFEAESAGGRARVPSTAMGRLVAAVGKIDPHFVVTSADGNEASGMANLNKALQIRHPTPDPSYNQGPTGQVYEPVNEDACAGLAAALALFGCRSLWLSYESFAVNGLPIWQTVTQALAELRYASSSAIAMFTAGALEQGRNGWTHQRPEVESYFAAMIRNGNVFPLFPCDANMIQVAYEWALGTHNKGIVITASKSPLPVYTTFELGRRALEKGAVCLSESPQGDKESIVFAVVGDMVLLAVFEAKETLERLGYRVRIVSVVNPRRLYRPVDLSWESVAEPDAAFISRDDFHSLFGADVLIGVSGGPGALLEPVILRSRAQKRDLVCWKRGDTSASLDEIMAFNGLTAEALVQRVVDLTS
ncbi:MAG: phosphoketolase [Acidobacteriota bacterium]